NRIAYSFSNPDSHSNPTNANPNTSAHINTVTKSIAYSYTAHSKAGKRKLDGYQGGPLLYPLRQSQSAEYANRRRDRAARWPHERASFSRACQPLFLLRLCS